MMATQPTGPAIAHGAAGRSDTRPVLVPSDSLLIGAVGDVMLGSWLPEILDRNGARYPFAETQSLLDRADFLIGNLEAPFLDDTTGVARAAKTYTFAVPEHHVGTLVAGGFDAVSLANNHILDFGLPGLERTWKLLEGLDIVHVGTGSDRAAAHSHRIVESGETRIALLAYNHVFPESFWATEHKPGTAHADDDGLAWDVQRARRESDLVIVSFHWSAELREHPKEYQQILARIAVDNGADLVVGHHPHVIQSLEWYRGRLIAYSLGNFVFASYSDSATGALLLVRFREGEIAYADFYPLDVNNLRREFQPKPMAPEEWSNLGSAVVNALADSARAGHRGVRIERDGYFRLISPE
jgi:poly-gamma-glutamate synthesis protein (capsule biosynthesis protein)